MKKYNHNSHVYWVLTRCLACSAHSAVHLSQFTPLQMEKLRQRRFDTSQTQCGICFFGSVTGILLLLILTVLAMFGILL